ncbi:DMT family transporter [Streptomyces meridianus]|uniref:DMT family transporter n=1 Tax=Streptomyces meridianus TaxID=2938945 RepID=A0ABT0XAQ0_9ACTN|nr:DMT family transporter [Streptomyces meridianus]MCM2579607.1 DMT family transporter [Streptomyces meridianus]
MDGLRAGLKAQPVVAAVFVIMWSSGFIGAAIGTAVSSAVTLLMWRFIVVGVLLVTWQFVIRRRRLTLREVAVLALLGIFSQSIYLFSMFKAVELGVTSGIVSLVDALQPVLASTLASLLLSEYISLRKWAGLAIGLLGVGVVISGDLGLRPGVPTWAYAIPFVGMVALTVATIIERKANLRTSLSDSLAVQCGASAVFFTVVGLWTGQAPMSTDGQFWLAIAWLIILSTMGGYGLYWIILQRHGVAYVSSLIYLTAPATMIWGYVMFGDRISLVSAVGLVVCVAGVYLVHRRNSAATSEQPSSMPPTAPQMELPELSTAYRPSRVDGGEKASEETP